jgi:outer membrane receptor protein involved in Fe transport
MHFLLIIILLLAAKAHAQQDTSTIRGLVTDPSGAAVPGVHVAVTDVKTNRVFTTRTDSKGEYYAPSLAVSVYNIRLTMQGFRTTDLNGITLDANETLAENVTLQLGAASQTIEVRAETVQVDTDSAAISSTITADQVAKLPLNGRDFIDLLALVPGAIQNTGSINNDSLGGFPSGQFGANVLVDGTDATRVDGNVTFTTFGRGNARLTRSSVDNIQEVKVLSSDYSAEYGSAVGEIVNVITKSGSNQLHGEVFDFFRNNALDAENYFFNGAATPLRLNQFGGNLGGKILKDKLFYFLNYEGVRQHITNPVTGETLVLNAAMRAAAVPSVAPIIAKIPVGNVGLGVTPSPQLFESKQPSISYEALDTATKIAGRNQFRLGFDIRWNNVGRELDTQDTLIYSGGPVVESATTLPCNGQPQGTGGCVDPIL